MLRYHGALRQRRAKAREQRWAEVHAGGGGGLRGEEEGERCPVCGGSRQEITLGRPVENLSE